LPADHRRFARAAPKRTGILGLLIAFAFVGYLQRAGVSIAAEQMMPSLGLSQVQIGWLVTVFLIGYTAFQVPGAAAGRRVGVRAALSLVGVLSVAATMATCLAPHVSMALVIFPLLLLSRLILGVAQAALFPVCSGAIGSSFPPQPWAFAQGSIVFGMWLGSAGIAAPLGGKITETLCVMYGERTGFRLVPLIALPGGAVCLYWSTVFATGAVLSMAAAMLWFWIDVTKQVALKSSTSVFAN